MLRPHGSLSPVASPPFDSHFCSSSNPTICHTRSLPDYLRLLLFSTIIDVVLGFLTTDLQNKENKEKTSHIFLVFLSLESETSPNVPPSAPVINRLFTSPVRPYSDTSGPRPRLGAYCRLSLVLVDNPAFNLSDGSHLQAN